jgi:hypothetical protein
MVEWERVSSPISNQREDNMTSAMCRCGLAILAINLFLVRPVAAGEGDLIKETQERLRVESQRLEVMVSDAILRSDQIGKSQPSRAIEILREAKGQVDADKESLKPERREALLRKISLAMNAWGERADNVRTTPGPYTGTGTPRKNPATDEALRQKEEAERRNSSAKGALDMRADIRRQTEEGFNRVNQEVLRSAIPEYRDIAYPRDWVEKMKRRTTGIKLTEEEKKIVKALGTPMTIEMEGKTFKEVLDYLKEKTGLPIVVDPRALEDLNITYNTPINLNLRNVTTRTVLKRLLGDLQLTYVMKDQSIQVTTPARAKELLTIRIYSVQDLIPVADMRIPPILNQINAYQTIQQLVLMITQTVEPDSWEVNGKGGLGTITFDPVRFMLVVKQTAEMHYLMGLSGR